MTVFHAESGYLEGEYLGTPYLGADVLGSMGMQVQIVINATAAEGQQAQFVIGAVAAEGQQATFQRADFLRPLGMQAQFVIDALRSLGEQAEFHVNDHASPEGQQANFVIATGSKTIGEQANLVIASTKAIGEQARFVLTHQRALGMQASIQIVDHPSAMGMQYKRDNIAHLQCAGYLEEDYLEFPYLAAHYCAHAGQQARFQIAALHALGMQAEIHVNDHATPKGMQAEFHINDHLTPMGQQVEFVRVHAIGMQATIVLYNTTLLRMLCDFPSRGLEGATGMNEWGNPAGAGQTWKSNSTAPGDFSPQNLNTDIVEQAWRSVDLTGVNLDCDTERSQGVFLDTFAMLEHNLTTDATLVLLGSNDPTFGVIGVTIPLQPRQDDPNTYYVAPDLPNQGWRFWRISIDDANNPDGYLQIGTVVFGAAEIFTGECFVDEVEFQLKDYTDSVQTEGFTNVNNSRAQKKVLRLEFRSLAYQKANFRIMRRMFRHERTVLKCLWLPTPDKNNEEYTARFALFSKLAAIPSERHNHKGGDADYVSFSIELDESK